MDIWEELYTAARKVQNDRAISPFIDAGGVAAALRTKAGNIYTGVCIDTAASLGMCAERNAMACMIAVMPDGNLGPPCCVCREFMMQLDRDSGEIEILLDYEARETVRLKELVPQWWGYGRFEP